MLWGGDRVNGGADFDNEMQLLPNRPLEISLLGQDNNKNSSGIKKKIPYTEKSGGDGGVGG